MELSYLPQLQTLFFCRCYRLLCEPTFPQMMVLWHLKALMFYDWRLESSVASPFLMWIAGSKNLSISGLSNESTTILFYFLNTLNSNPFQDNLECLSIIMGEMDDDLSTILLCEIIKIFPKLRLLDLSDNNIRSIQPVVEKIKMDTSL